MVAQTPRGDMIGVMKLKIATFFIVTLGLLVGLFSPLWLQPAHAESGQALSISPPLVDVKSDPGKPVTVTIKVTNISSGDLLIKNQINDFGAKNESGEPNIIFDDNQTTSYSLRNWVSAPDPFILGANQSKNVVFEINVPNDAEPGGHYAVFRFTGKAPELEDSGVALSASIGSLVLLKVSGTVAEQANILDFYSATPTFEKSGFFESGPIGFVERIENKGNIHIQPTGTVEIFDMFGKKVQTLRVNGDPGDPKNPPRSVLPNSIRKFEQVSDKKWMLGPYSAKLKLTYGQEKTTIESSTSFWVIPYKLIILILLLILVVFFGGRWLIRRYNAHVVKKAQGLQSKSSTKSNARSKSKTTKARKK